MLSVILCNFVGRDNGRGLVGRGRTVAIVEEDERKVAFWFAPAHHKNMTAWTVFNPDSNYLNAAAGAGGGGTIAGNALDLPALRQAV